jgi:Family of unknown function (DUF6491)
MFKHAISCSGLLIFTLLAGGVVEAQQDPETEAAPARETARERRARESAEEEREALARALDAVAQDEFLDRSPEDCISVNRIRNTEVLDDRTILFYMRGSRVYRNFLRDNCPNLGRSKRFLLESRTGRLCESDLITVLEQFSSRLDPGFTCRIGAFHPVTKAEAELMELDPDAATAIERSVEITPVELPEDEAAVVEGNAGQSGEDED